jgi:hypothetical protein
MLLIIAGGRKAVRVVGAVCGAEDGPAMGAGGRVAA